MLRNPVTCRTFGPDLPTISYMLRVAQGPGVDFGSLRYQELVLRCPYRSGATYATLCWHPCYQGKVQVVIHASDTELRLDVIECLGLIKRHHVSMIWQSCVNLQINRGRAWQARQATAPQAADLRAERRREQGAPHPAVWDTAAFPES